MTAHNLRPLRIPPYPAVSPNGHGATSDRVTMAWPTLDPAALYGLPGEVVGTIDPHTEADQAGVLVSFLVAAGAAIGGGPHAFAEVPHPPRLFAVLVGETAEGRKGSTWGNVRRVLATADSPFMTDRVRGGFGSGEAIVDAFSGSEKRLLVKESEFARVLNVASKDGSILSPMIRQAWDDGRLEARARGASTQHVDDAHVCVLAHVTPEELRSRMTQLEVANGLGNRFLFALVKRSKRLPRGGNLDEESVTWLGKKLGPRLESARTVERMSRTHEAEKRWAELYDEMGDDRPPGMLGALIARAEPQVLRLSVTYALLEGARVIELDHLEAAWALWRYCRQSAEFLFGSTVGDRVADRILTLLRATENGMLSRSDVGRSFAHKLRDVDRAIDLLEGRGLVSRVTLRGNGRPPTWICLVEGR